MSTAVVLCLVLRRDGAGTSVLLGHKQRGFGAGKIVLPGGKIEPGESAAVAAARELAEETGLTTDPGALREVAGIRFEFPSQPQADMECTVMLAPHTAGTLRDTDELHGAWHPADALPTDRMWEDSPRWLVPLIEGRALDVHVVLSRDNEGVAGYTVTERRVPGSPERAAVGKAEASRPRS